MHCNAPEKLAKVETNASCTILHDFSGKLLDPPRQALVGPPALWARAHRGACGHRRNVEPELVQNLAVCESVKAEFLSKSHARTLNTPVDAAVETLDTMVAAAVVHVETVDVGESARLWQVAT